MLADLPFVAYDICHSFFVPTFVVPTFVVPIFVIPAFVVLTFFVPDICRYTLMTCKSATLKSEILELGS